MFSKNYIYRPNEVIVKERQVPYHIGGIAVTDPIKLQFQVSLNHVGEAPSNHKHKKESNSRCNKIPIEGIAVAGV